MVVSVRRCDTSAVDSSLEKLLVQCATLPSLPAVAVEILAECRKDDINLDRICELLERDPALATKILSVANSSVYRRGTAVTTIRRATVALGANAVTALALSFSLCSQRSGKGSFDFSRFWRRALLSAICARVLARWAQVDPDEALLGGLLQDIGVLALQTAVPNYDILLHDSEGNHKRLEALERERLGAGHPEVGAWLATRLRLPAPLARAVSGSHGPPPSGDPSTDLLGRCVAVSGYMAETWLADPSDTTAHAAAEVASSWLALEPAVFDGLLAEVATGAQSFAEPFEVALPSSEHMRALLQEARQTLVRVPVAPAKGPPRATGPEAVAPRRREPKSR
jgi:HD-like signal output (HDOD) protein